MEDEAGVWTSGIYRRLGMSRAIFLSWTVSEPLLTPIAESALIQRLGVSPNFFIWFLKRKLSLDMIFNRIRKFGLISP
jgi:hypothetical protein